MLVLTIPFTGPINWDLLKSQAEQVFPPDTFIDCNATDNNTTVSVYLDDGLPNVSTSAPTVTVTGKISPLANAQTTWQSIVVSHDPTQLSLSQQQAKAKAAAASALGALNKSTLDPTIANILTFLGF